MQSCSDRLLYVARTRWVCFEMQAMLQQDSMMDQAAALREVLDGSLYAGTQLPEGS